MCGILGHFSFGDARADVELWRALVNLIGHRGPDDSTFWHDGPFVFGHRRLSIIDLAEGSQPMATDDGRLVVVFNGEIYNYVELRDQLTARGYRFRTQSDTEVLLHGYREWRTELPCRLRGMFAFALADRARRELFVARDRFGEKPLFYTQHAGGVSFGSEMKVLAALPELRRDVDDESLAAFLCLNYVPGTATMMRDVQRIGPATWHLWAADGCLRAGSYWSPPDPREADLAVSMGEAAERLETLLDASVRIALRSDVPVGILLSGGIDSSLVARSAARAGRLSAAYCLTFGDASYSEWPKAEATARQLGVPLNEVRIGPEALDDFLRLVEHADDPLADSSGLAVWTLARAVAREVKVVLSGDGGDELFGGYLTYPATLAHAALTSRLPMTIRRTLARSGVRLPTSERKVSSTYKARRFLRALHLAPAIAHFTWNGTWLPEEARRLVTTPMLGAAAANALKRLAVRHALPARPTLRELQNADVRDYLPNDILAKSDRMSMAHGLEVRTPFLDPDLAAFALRLPASLKISPGGTTKAVLRHLAGRTYGVDLAGARKQGFSIPVHAWLRGPARPLAEDLLSRTSVAGVAGLDPRAIGAVVADHMSGRRSYGFELWGLMVLVAWHRQYVRQPVLIPRGPLPREVDIAACAA
jgi:asparagine synthase (glutamine-hydrolysing)